MSHKSAKNITRRSWDTIPMPDTVIARVNEISCNEPNKFIFTDRIVCPVGDVETTGVDRDTDYINKNKAPTRPSLQVPGNRRDRGGASHKRSKN